VSTTSQSEHALVIGLNASGESYLKITALSADSGAFFCLKRLSKKNPHKDAPDIFDTAEIELETARSGSTRFVRDYRTLNRRNALGTSYRKLHCASEFFRLIAHNAPLMGDYSNLFNLCEQSLDAFTERPQPEIVHLKSLYRLLQIEGYPVAESWWPQLNSGLKTEARELLNQPTPDTVNQTTIDNSKVLIESLLNWLQRETDFVLPSH
jgi:recombinational DNA repair protein (RecF pathway)